ncbi:MAG: iron-sulfur cluster assembly protein [Planctomycetaceae bacterium]
MAEFERVASLSDLPAEGRLSVFIDDEPALLIRLGDTIYGIEDVCTHDGQPLTEGPIIEGQIVCPRHGARFDLKTGQATCMPATQPIATFAVEIRDGEIYARRRSANETFTEANVGGATASPTATPTANADAGENGPGDSERYGEKIDDAKLIEALQQVIDPELMINIVDLGLIYEVSQEANKVNVLMTLTSPACPAGPQIVQQAKMALEKLKDVDEAEIRLTLSPPWTPARMTDAARDQLGIF